MEQLAIKEGEILEGKYRLTKLLGEGAMGAVYRATHLTLEHTVAIKFLKRAADGAAERRFLREARIAVKLKSQHVAKVHDVGLHEGKPYIVMEYLEGEDLEALLDRVGPLGVEQAVGYVLDVCDALAEAHALGIVHRDVKPSNVMLAKGVPDACIKVLDFGISKARGAFGANATQEARLTASFEGMGTPLYVAPEQINDAANVDGRADIWSLGAMLYQLLTGTTPWTGKDVLGIITAMATQAPTPIADLRADVPPGLGAIVEQCLQRDRDRRWPNLPALAAALVPYGPPSAAALVKRIAAYQALPDVEPARPTVPVSAAGEVSALGWVGAEKGSTLSDSAGRGPLPSRTEVALVAVPARTSDGGEAAPKPGRLPLALGAAALAVAVVAALYFGLRPRATDASQGPAQAPTPVVTARAAEMTSPTATASQLPAPTTVVPVTTSAPVPSVATGPAPRPPVPAMKGLPVPSVPVRRGGTDMETSRK